MHNDYTLFVRTYPNGKKVVFYYAYDRKNIRKGPWTTKSKGLTAARNYCNRLIKTETLIPVKIKPLTFGEFAQGFWENGSKYIQNQKGRADITPSYIDSSRRRTINQILPFFADWPLEKITAKDVNNWLLGFKRREVTVKGKKVVKVYKNSYANTVFGTLYTMLAWAEEQELIKANPCAKVKKLKDDHKKIEIITVEEVQRLFTEKWEPVWNGNETAYIANRLASLTGMRSGEILGLRGEYVFDDYIYVCGNYGDFGYGPIKTKENRFIPLIPEMITLLKKLMEQNGKGFVFSDDGGATPISRKNYYNEFKRALQRIGISREEITRRGLTFHGWRHFLNTELQNQGLTLQQVQAVIGHKSASMTARYSHFDARQLSRVMDVQKLITGNMKPDETGGKAEPKNGPENPPTAGMTGFVLPFKSSERKGKQQGA